MSAVDIQVDGQWRYNLQDWQVVGDSTPLIAGDMTGGAGTLSFGLPEAKDSKLLNGRPVVLHDPEFGTTSGRLGLAGGNGENVTIAGTSWVGNLNVSVTAEPFSGTLRGYIIYVLGLVGVTDDFLIEQSLAVRPVDYIGWEGNALDRLKDLCAAHQMELTLIGDNLVFRVALKRAIRASSFHDYTWEMDEGRLAQAVEVNWYETGALQAQLLYPPGGWNESVQVLSVDAGETSEIEVDLVPKDDGQWGASIASVLQPVCVADVPRNYTGTQSVYAVSGKDGLPIPPAQWTDGGGSLTVEVLEGGSRLKVTIVAPPEEQYAPYQIAMSSGTSDHYSSLRLYGTGVLYRKHTLRWKTGLDDKAAPQETAPAVDSPFISDYDAAARAAAGLLSRHSGPVLTIQGTIGHVRSLPSTPTTFFGTSQTVPEDPATHAFGNLEGSMVWIEDTVLRIRSVTYTPTGATFTAEQHATDSAVALALAGVVTDADWAAFYPAGATAEQISAIRTIGYES